MAEKGKKLGSVLTYIAGIGIVAGAAYGVFTIWTEKDAQLFSARKALADTVERGPRVQVVTVGQGPKERLITLLGDTRADQTAVLYSKVGGYLKSISVDRGDPVEAGQVVAEIDSAETDMALTSALTIALSYIAGGFIPLSAYIFIPTASTALSVAIVMTLIALFVFGYIKGTFTGAKPWLSAIQTVLIGGIAAAVAFAIARAITPR